MVNFNADQALSPISLTKWSKDDNGASKRNQIESTKKL